MTAVVRWPSHASATTSSRSASSWAGTWIELPRSSVMTTRNFAAAAKPRARSSADFAAAEGEPEPVDAIHLNLSFLARFDARHLIRDRKAEKTEPGRLAFFGPTKPVLVTFGTHFRGLLVPIRGM